MDAFILDAVRTPRGKGKPSGALHGQRPVDLIACVLQALERRTDLDTSAVEDLILGCVTQVGDQGANIARIGALFAGWSEAVAGITVNRVCCSSLDALGMAAARLHAGCSGAIVAGGVESMSRVPLMSDEGAWFSDPEVARRTGYVYMAEAADLLATRSQISRPRLDEYSALSHARAAEATRSGAFSQSMIPVVTPAGALLLDRDELIRPDSRASALATLDPLLRDPASRAMAARYPEVDLEHVHTIASAPGLADAAAVLLLSTRDQARRLGLVPRARVVGVATHSVEPVQMLDGNVACVQKLLSLANLGVHDVDCFEINESFAAVPLHFLQNVDCDADKLNPLGGAIAMGHPLGATGAILLCTLLDRLEARAGTFGVASICGGAGVTTSVLIERV